MDILFGRDQLPVLAAFLVLGAVMGVFADVLRIKRRLLFDGAIVRFFDDLIWMLLCGALIIGFAYCFNDGNLRWFELPAMLISFAAYRMTVSVLFVRASFFVIDALKKLLARLTSPFMRLFACIGKKIAACTAKAHRNRLQRRAANRLVRAAKIKEYRTNRKDEQNADCQKHRRHHHHSAVVSCRRQTADRPQRKNRRNQRIDQSLRNAAL